MIKKIMKINQILMASLDFTIDFYNADSLANIEQSGSMSAFATFEKPED